MSDKSSFTTGAFIFSGTDEGHENFYTKMKIKHAI